MAHCTALDHIYPKKKFGTPCSCGARVWGKRYTAESPGISKSQAKRLAVQRGTVASPAVASPVDVQDTEKSNVPVEKVLASDARPDVGSLQNSEAATQTATHNTGETKMTATLTFKGLSKSGKYAMYSGLRTVIRVATTNFPDSKPVPSFTADGDFAGPREKKAPLTAEERKALRASKPKLTLAERIAKEETRLAKLREKAAKEAEAQPVGASA